MEKILTNKIILKLKKKIKVTYSYLFQKISNENNLAKSQNKFCVILTGDDHLSNYSILIESMILMICSQLQYKNLALELDDERYLISRQQSRENPYSFLNSFYNKMNNLKRLNEHKSHYFIDIEKIALQNNIAIHLIDKACKKTYEQYQKTNDLNNAYNKEKIKIRDHVMACEINQINNHCMVIVGAAHLSGISTLLQQENKFHVYTINTANKNHPHIMSTMSTLSKDCVTLEDIHDIFYESDNKLKDVAILKQEDIENLQIKLAAMLDVIKNIHEEIHKDIHEAQKPLSTKKILGKRKNHEENDLLFSQVNLTQSNKKLKIENKDYKSYCNIL